MSSFWSNSHMAPMFESLFLRLVHLCGVFENCFFRLSNDWNHFYETTDHLQQFRADKFSTRAKPLPSPRLVKLIRSTLTGNVATHRKVFAPFLFIGFARKMIPFFWFSLKRLRSFLSLFSSDYQFCVVWFFIKELFYEEGDMGICGVAVLMFFWCGE